MSITLNLHPVNRNIILGINLTGTILTLTKDGIADSSDLSTIPTGMTLEGDALNHEFITKIDVDVDGNIIIDILYPYVTQQPTKLNNLGKGIAFKTQYIDPVGDINPIGDTNA